MGCLIVQPHLHIFTFRLPLPSSNAHLKTQFNDMLNVIFVKSQNEYPFFILYIILLL